MNKKRLNREILDYNLPEEMKVPDECQILYIMRRKYSDLVEHFNDAENKEQLEICRKEYQRFSYVFQKMHRNLVFDPDNIEEQLYLILNEETKSALANREVVAEMNRVRIRQAGDILSDKDVKLLNFQIFEMACELFSKEKAREYEKEEEKKKEMQDRMGASKKGGFPYKTVMIINFMILITGAILYWLFNTYSGPAIAKPGL